MSEGLYGMPIYKNVLADLSKAHKSLIFSAQWKQALLQLLLTIYSLLTKKTLIENAKCVKQHCNESLKKN